MPLDGICRHSDKLHGLVLILMQNGMRDIDYEDYDTGVKTQSGSQDRARLAIQRSSPPRISQPRDLGFQNPRQ
ncbi:hypothetical protein QC762_0058380 [Podospora pseudocomata]|uniref:Uncharacterized protein n=1 Tax=Podospora pseudocomata TaxID=2093779 RepID=A0ABR0GKG9_9PEZI|nr:hypothetical protein QC762_0058380 [Podospora pseudocomata]